MRRFLLVSLLLFPLLASAQRRSVTCAYGIDAPPVYEAPRGTWRFFAADFDGDGRVDVGAAGARAFQVRENGSPGEARTFELKVLDVADLAGDALPDLLLDGFAVAENRGDGTFAAPRAIEGARGAYAIGDFTGDGKDDVVFLSAIGNTLTLHARGGDALVRRDAQFLPEPGRAVARANVNADGIDDLLVLHAGGRAISVWRGTASGVFGFVESFVPDGVAKHVLAADVDGDGRTEVIAVVDHHLDVYRRGGIERVTSRSALNVQAHDFDGDGADDLLVDGVIFISEEGRMREAAPAPYVYPAAPVTAGDFNGDGAAELLVPTYSGFAIVPPFTPRPRPALPEAVQGYGHVILDMNADGRDDYVFGRDRAVHVAIDDGAGGFTIETLPVRPVLAILSATPDEITVIDQNDIPRRIEVFRRGANGAWPLERTVVAAPEAVGARTADLDGDGTSETIVFENSLLSGRIPRLDHHRLKIFSGRTGALLFERDHGPRPIEIAIDDLNADGVADLLLVMHASTRPSEGRPQTLRDGFVQVLYGVRGGVLGEPVTVAIKAVPRAPRTGDFNGDGRRDVAYLDDWALVAQYGTEGGFTAAAGIATPGPHASTIEARDRNGDGMTDLVTNGWAEFTLAAGSRDGLVRIGTFYGVFSATRTPCRAPKQRGVRH